MKRTHLDNAEDLIRQTGGRATFARIKILGLLLSQRNAVTHHEIEEALGSQERLDRVTLYRVLDWLTDNGLAHKVQSGDRAWRFRANDHASSPHEHAHFRCNHCAAVICLDDAKPEHDVPLPSGYLAQEVQLTVRGLCARCA